MVLFDKFDPDNFNIDNQVLDASPRTLSEIREEYIELGTLQSWPLGSQEASESLGILSRTYKELTFAADAKDFDFNDAGFEDDTYGGQYFWRVLQDFTETEYYSDSSVALRDFTIWEVGTNTYQMEIIYRHEILLTVEWERENNEVPIIETPPPPMSMAPPTYACPIGGSTPDTPTETGDSDYFPVVDGDTDPSNDICRQWLSLDKPFSLIFDAGAGLGAVYDANLAPDRVFLKSQPTDLTGDPVTGTGSFTDPIRMYKRYLVLEWDDPGKGEPIDSGLTNVSVDFYGVEFYRSFLPLSRDLDPDLEEHSVTVEKIPHVDDLPNPKPITRYKPPSRQDFPDNFWNDQVIQIAEDYGARLGVTPSVTEG